MVDNLRYLLYDFKIMQSIYSLLPCVWEVESETVGL